MDSITLGPCLCVGPGIFLNFGNLCATIKVLAPFCSGPRNISEQSRDNTSWSCCSVILMRRKSLFSRGFPSYPMIIVLLQSEITNYQFVKRKKNQKKPNLPHPSMPFGRDLFRDHRATSCRNKTSWCYDGLRLVIITTGRPNLWRPFWRASADNNFRHRAACPSYKSRDL